MNTDAKRTWIIVVCFYMNTQTGSEWSQGLLLPMTVMLTTGAFIKSAVPGREKEGERKDGCEYGASRDGCKMKDGREEENMLLRVELGQRMNKEDKTFVLSIKRMCQQILPLLLRFLIYRLTSYSESLQIKEK